MQKGKLIVLTGPSGVGKGTLLKAILSRHPELCLSISVTTRSPRPGEVDGENYYFISHDRFKEMVEKDLLLEWAEYAGNYYGTPRQQVEMLLKLGKWVILEIELEGARAIAYTFPNALRVFILPPSFPELEHRIRDRAQDSEIAMQKRLDRAKIEIAAADEFDIQIINDEFQETIKQIEAAIFNS